MTLLCVQPPSPIAGVMSHIDHSFVTFEHASKGDTAFLGNMHLQAECVVCTPLHSYKDDPPSGCVCHLPLVQTLPLLTILM